MTLSDYQIAALQTAIYPRDIALAYTTMGLVGEAGEIANKVKKIYRDHDGKLPSLDRHGLASEIGDVIWYCAMLAHELGYTLDEIAQANVKKLQTRKAAGTLSGSGDQR